MNQPFYSNQKDAEKHLVSEARKAWKKAGTASLTYADLLKYSDTVTRHAVLQYVGGIVQLLKLAGIPPHRFHRDGLSEEDVFNAMRIGFVRLKGVTTQSALEQYRLD